MTAVRLLAPAKLNLGVVVTGRRPDGFHDLVTIFQTISRCDEVTFSLQRTLDHSTPTLLRTDDPRLAGPDNLIHRAVDVLRAHTGRRDAVTIELTKRIPAAAGLGGASSDAAATLLGLDQLWRLDLPPTALHDLATALGSDVPFFLSGGTALGTGRGEILEPLPDLPDRWFVVVVPALEDPFERKTATLFAALRQSDFGNGTAILRQANRLKGGAAPDTDLLTNTFERALYALRPELIAVRAALVASGAGTVAVSGAGPAHYAIADTEVEADRIMDGFRTLYSGNAAIFRCRTVPRDGQPRPRP